MNSRFIIIAILIFIKVIGVASHARADFSYEDHATQWKKEFEERKKEFEAIRKQNEKNEWRRSIFGDHWRSNDMYGQWERERIKKEREWLNKEWLEEDTDTKIITNITNITNIDDHSYTVDYLNGKKEYCYNDFGVIACLDYSLVPSSRINQESNKKTNGKISKDEESEMKAKEEFILSMTLSTLFNIT